MILPKLPNLLFWMFQTSLHKQTNKQTSKQASKQANKQTAPKASTTLLPTTPDAPAACWAWRLSGPNPGPANDEYKKDWNHQPGYKQFSKPEGSHSIFHYPCHLGRGSKFTDDANFYSIYIYLYSNIKGRTSTTIPKLESSTKEGATGQPRTSGVSWNSSPSPTPLSAATAQKKLRRIPGTLLISTALWRVVMNLFLLFEMPMLGDRQCLLYSVANHDIIIFAAAVSGSHPLTFS